MHRKYKLNKIKSQIILLEDKENKMTVINKRTIKIGGYNNNKTYKNNYIDDYEDYYYNEY